MPGIEKVANIKAATAPKQLPLYVIILMAMATK